MAYADYDADATELLETYGAWSVLYLDTPSADSLHADFLMKFIIIGAQSACAAADAN